MKVSQVIDQFLSFIPGFRLIDGGELLALANRLLSAQGSNGITALAGGGLAGAPQVSAYFTRVDVCVTNNDSVALPPAIPGQEFIIENNTGQTLAVFAQTDNPNNGDAADLISAQGALYGAATASVTIATGISTNFFCSKMGFWKAD